MKKLLGIYLFLSFCQPSFGNIQLGSPRILVEPSPTPTPPKDYVTLDESNINSETLLRMIEEVVNHDHPEMYDRWKKYLRSQNLDPDNEEKTMVRLEQKYLDSIQSWGKQIEDCDSARSSGRWMRRLKRKFGAHDVNLHKKDIAKIITSLYLQRKTECMQAHEELALRAEREIYAFSLERTRLLIDFISMNSEIHISQLNKYRLISALKKKQSSHTLSERTVDINSLRLETKLQNLPKLYVDFLSHEQSFKKPFDLHKNLSMLSEEFEDTPKKVRRSKKQSDVEVQNATL